MSVQKYPDSNSLDLIDETNMESNSSTKAPTQRSVKEFVENKAPGEGVRLTITPSVNLSANRLINVSNNYATSAQYGYAVTTEAVTSGNPTDVVVTGIAFVELGENGFYAGDEIIAGTDGKGVLQTGSDTVSGIALEDGGNGDVIKVKLV